MKTVWVLEKYITEERAEEIRAELLEMAEELGSDDQKIADIKNKQIAGWSGVVGRSVYKQFCEDAKERLWWGRQKQENDRFRVVKAEIADNSKVWTGYKNAVVNDGVMRYLYATM